MEATLVVTNSQPSDTSDNAPSLERQERRWRNPLPQVEIKDRTHRSLQSFVARGR